MITVATIQSWRDKLTTLKSASVAEATELDQEYQEILPILNTFVSHSKVEQDRASAVCQRMYRSSISIVTLMEVMSEMDAALKEEES